VARAGAAAGRVAALGPLAEAIDDRPSGSEQRVLAEAVALLRRLVDG
jgi:hypothetical protein